MILALVMSHRQVLDASLHFRHFLSAALWFHNVISEEFGVAVNVFWKHLPAECYDKSDTYGNKDPMVASRAIQILDRALKTLEELPEEYRDFYARRMVSRIQEKAYRNDYG